MRETTVLPPGRQPQQFTVMIDSSPGALAAVIRLLHKRGVCVLGVTVQDAYEVKFARFVVNDPEEAEAVFIESGIPYATKQVIVLALLQGSEAMMGILDVLFRSEVLVSILYPMFPHPHGYSLMVLSVDDTTFAQGILHAAGFRIMMMEDLCR